MKNILKILLFVILTVMIHSCDQDSYLDENGNKLYQADKNDPIVTTLDMVNSTGTDSQVGDDWATLSGSVKWEHSTSDHSFDCMFAISEDPEFSASVTDTVGYSGIVGTIAKEDTTLHYYSETVYNLSPSTTYYYTFIITDGYLKVNGNTCSFKTLD